MKKLLLLILLTACNGGLTSTHEVRYSPDGKDSVVYMMYYDGKQYNNVYMTPLQFNGLFDEGGYEGVYDYYISHQLPEYWLNKYKSYEKR
jgi:hypothetical protein